MGLGGLFRGDRGAKAATPPFVPREPSHPLLPAEPEPAADGLAGRFAALGRNPLFNFGLNLLAQDGYSTTPGPGLGARLARAGLATAEGQREREEADRQTALQRALLAFREAQAEREAARAEKPQLFNTGGAIVAADPDGGTEVLYREPEGEPEPTALQRNWEWFSKLSPEEQAQARAMLPGFVYTPEGIQAQAKAAGARAAAVEPYQDKGGGAGKPVKVQATRVVGGRPYYKINGSWYDNPEGQ